MKELVTKFNFKGAFTGWKLVTGAGLLLTLLVPLIVLQEPAYQGWTLTRWLMRDSHENPSLEEVIQNIGSAKALPVLAGHLQATDPPLLGPREAFWQLAGRPLAFDRPLSGEEMRQRAASALAYCGPSAVPLLIEALESSSEDVQFVVMESLRALRATNAIPHLLKKTDHPATAVRRAAVSSLLGISTSDPRILEAVERACEEPAVRRHVTVLLIHYQVRTPFAVSLMIESLDSRNLWLREQARRRLEDLSTDFPQAAEALRTPGRRRPPVFPPPGNY